jgi:uncharacterized damage-inducible protein DinB
MNKRMGIAGVGVLVLAMAAGNAVAQGKKADEGPTRAHVLGALVSNAEREFVPAAEAMPEEKYSFAPSNGEFHGVRTFAEQIKHVAAANYQLAARILGEKPPAGTVGAKSETAPDSVQSKPQVMDYLRASFAYLHKAVNSIDSANEVEPIPGVNGVWERTRLGAAVDAIAHTYDHYGQMVEYLRMNGIVPPASR